MDPAVRLASLCRVVDRLQARGKVPRGLDVEAPLDERFVRAEHGEVPVAIGARARTCARAAPGSK